MPTREQINFNVQGGPQVSEYPRVRYVSSMRVCVCALIDTKMYRIGDMRSKIYGYGEDIPLRHHVKPRMVYVVKIVTQ